MYTHATLDPLAHNAHPLEPVQPSHWNLVNPAKQYVHTHIHILRRNSLFHGHMHGRATAGFTLPYYPGVSYTLSHCKNLPTFSYILGISALNSRLLYTLLSSPSLRTGPYSCNHEAMVFILLLCKHTSYFMSSLLHLPVAFVILNNCIKPEVRENLFCSPSNHSGYQ